MKRLTFLAAMLLAVGLAAYALDGGDGVWFDTEAVIAKVGHKVVCTVTSTSEESADYQIVIYRRSGNKSAKGGNGLVAGSEDGSIEPWESKHLEVPVPSGSTTDRLFLCKVHLEEGPSCVDCGISGRVSILVRDTAGRAYGTGDAPPQKAHKKNMKTEGPLCEEVGESCETSTDCCSGACGGNQCQCREVDEPCATDADCCPGLECVDGSLCEDTIK